MQLPELKDKLSKEQVDSFYIFTGPEVAVLDVYLTKIAQLAKLPLRRVDTLARIYSKLTTRSVVSTPACYVIRDDKDIMAREEVLLSLMQGTTQGKNIIILVYTSLDKRTKFYKSCEKRLVEFEKLSPEVLVKYIEQRCELPAKPFGLELAAMCENDLSRIFLECDKLSMLSQAEGIPIVEAFNRARETKLIYSVQRDVIFDFVGAVCRREANAAFRLQQIYEAETTSPLAAISVLYNNVRSMLLVQSAGKTKDITARTGLSSWQAKQVEAYGNRYTIGELVKALRLIRETEKDIKTGQLDAALSLDYILTNIL